MMTVMKDVFFEFDIQYDEYLHNLHNYFRLDE